MNRKIHCQLNPGECTCLADMVRRACPKLGGDWVKFMAVMLKPGIGIDLHQHPEHTVLFFPQDCEPVTVTPKAGSMLYLPPGTEHSVAAVKEPRLSVAMLVDLK